MSWLGVVLLISVGVALLRGGRLLNLSEVSLRGWPLLVVGFSLQAAAAWIPADEEWSRRVAVSLIILSYIPLLLLVGLNRRAPGMLLAGIGVFMNFTVIALNGGMPVLPEAAALAEGLDPDTVIDFTRQPKHVELSTDARLPFLGDVIPMRVIGSVISLGDIFLAIGLGIFLENQLRKPVRWFKHGLNEAEAGSAATQRPSQRPIER